MSLTTNTLFFGDNLKILRENIATESVDLIYLDPPFNSNRNYNVLFKNERGREAEAQIQAFEDTWQWGHEAEQTYHELVTAGPPHVSTMIAALHQFIGPSQMLAYLVMMTVRLVELHRVLKPTGSFYLHCDPTASHYLKTILDTIFGPTRFRTEIIWKRSSAHSDTKQGRQQHGRIHDVVLFYTKSDVWTWNPIFTPYDASYIDQFYRHVDPATGRRYRLSDLTAAKPGGDTSYLWKGVGPYKGRFWAYSRENMELFETQGRLAYAKSGMPSYKRYLDEMPGIPLQDVWDDVPPIGASAAERLGYPTQKPLALLERIIQSSSNPGDILLDPFCGCGTAVAAAQKLDRRWLGIDITWPAVDIQRRRLQAMFPGCAFDVKGQPQDIASAKALAEGPNGRYQFQYWALSLVEAQPLTSPGSGRAGKKGQDRGIDGVITFLDQAGKVPQRVLSQVKSGHVTSGDVRDLRGTIEREKAAMGVFITLKAPSPEMNLEAVKAGFYESVDWDKTYPRLQILSIEELLQGKTVQMPPASAVYKQASRASVSLGEQLGLTIPQ